MPDDVSLIIRERQEVLRQAGMDEEDIAKMQAFFSDAYYNIVPTLFWTIYEICSRPQLLRDIRNEISSKAVVVQKSSSLMSEGGGDEGKEKSALTLDISALKTECAILLSTYQEVQRRRHEQATSRIVAEDTLLDGRYLLKRGHWFQMPVQPVHANRDIWGPDADMFDPYRFVPHENEGRAETETKVKTKIQPNSFLPWGVAPYTCPARQFVSTEVMVVTALLLMQVDLRPVGREGTDWERDPATRRFEKPTLARPKKDVRVKLTPREGSGLWNVMLGRSMTRIPLASG
jgi:cytochrome P450